MEIQVTKQTKIKEIPTEQFNVSQINSIKHLKGGAYRQDSKAPTFSFDLRWYLPRDDEQSRLARGQSQDD